MYNRCCILSNIVYSLVSAPIYLIGVSTRSAARRATRQYSTVCRYSTVCQYRNAVRVGTSTVGELLDGARACTRLTDWVAVCAWVIHAVSVCLSARSPCLSITSLPSPARYVNISQYCFPVHSWYGFLRTELYWKLPTSG